MLFALTTTAVLLLPVAAAADVRSQAAAADVRLDTADRQRIEALERAVLADPENLHVAAEYRQFMIACGEFDRATKLFETLTKRATGPNAEISLALAYVDKVPVSGNLRRLYLARDALRALTRAIEQQPS